MKLLDPQFIFEETSSGIINDVKWNLAPQNSVGNAVNVVFDEVLGEAVVRKGCTLVGAALNGTNNAIAGLHFISNSSGSVSRLIAVANSGSNNIIKYYNGATWVDSSITTDTVGAKTRFVTFLDYTVRLNGAQAPVTSQDGITWGVNTALDDANFPSLARYGIVYKAQLVVAGSSTRPDSIFISSVPNASGASISWTSGNREIVINPSDGQNITGLGIVGTTLIIFKDRSMYRWNNRTTDADQVVRVGCSSQESIVNCGSGLLAFFNPQGIYLTSGDQPILISRRIQNWIDGMSSSYYTSVAGYGDETYVYMSLGDCTVNGTTYNNVVARYTIATKEWTIFSYANQFRCFTLFVSSGAPIIVGGDSTNKVLQIESTSLTDNGTAIGYQVESQELTFGSRGMIKEISERVIGYGKNPSNCLVQVKADSNDWVTLGGLDSSVKQFTVASPLRGHYFKFRVIGTSASARMRFQGIELPNVTIFDYGD